MPAGNGSASARRQPATAARQLLGKALRRGARRMDTVQARLLGEQPVAPARPRRRPAAPPAAKHGASGGRRVQTRPATADPRDSFFRVLGRTGDLGSAAAAGTRAYLRQGNGARARTFAQVLQQQAGSVRQVGDICLAMTAVTAELPGTAWRLFTGAELGEVLRLAPAEYLRTAFGQDPTVAAEALAALLAGEYRTEADAAAWLDMAATSLLAGRVELSRAALGRALAGLEGITDAAARERVRGEARWLRSWYDRALEVAGSDLPAVAVLGYLGPDRAACSANLGEYLESLAVLGRLVGHRDFAAAADDRLAPVIEAVRARQGGGAGSAAATVRLLPVDRDASAWARVPDGTWVMYTGVLPQPLFGVRRDLPLDARLRPIFVSVHVDSARALSGAAIGYLREHAPIGCRDWSSVLLLQAAGVPAFFAGSVLSTLGGLARAGAARTGVLAVDVPGRGDTALSQDAAAVRRGDLAGNLRAALEHVDALAGAGRVRTSRLHSYLAARALGIPVRFRPENRAQRRLWGLLDLDDPALAAMRRGIEDKLAAVYGAILAGKPEEEVYAAWRAACAADVDRAEAFRADVPPMPPPVIAIPAACATIRDASVTVERSAPGGDGAEINVELSLDGNYKHQLEVVLDSIVTHTTRPVRAFVLCRDHTQADFDRMAALFPEVSFVWLPTDSVEYGRVIVLCGSVATLDRLLLPDLLPEVSRIVHHDLDALCLADLGELHDVELNGAPLAAVMSPQQNHLSGFAALMRRAESFRRDPERAHEYLLRTHTRHRFDYNVLNAGIMTLDLDTMRADDFCRNFLPFVERFALSDQALLNVYAGANRVELEPEWNWRPWLDTMPNPKIAHWAGPQKPWKDTWVVGRDLWRAGEARVAARRARTAG